MPDTLTPYELDAIRQRDQNAQNPARTHAIQDRRALLAHIDAMTAAVRALPVMVDDDHGDEYVDRAAVLAILNGEDER